MGFLGRPHYKAYHLQKRTVHSHYWRPELAIERYVDERLSNIHHARCLLGVSTGGADLPESSPKGFFDKRTDSSNACVNITSV